MRQKEARYLARVASLGCICCKLMEQASEATAEIHHLRDGQGMAQRGSNWTAIPLCPECHRGSLGIHGDKTYLRILKMDELDLLAATIEALN